ncbi:4-hydroxythreonine-4-phosphate dehydrogenase PdxA [Chelativorans sp. Marseille-P2723]|uniref:4-hydroxythreonine-4-phosphate dehydrogenase PdxA n=1 Tax=Chelativorans sp. Marseille-P2723 TaxID=2709133 RepID=UPI00156E8BFF|nr:4-hydroxythreonine-4-phosphate dehydrogenase PdxA [Chelativorans sp. Marseille-P2723]
MNGKRIAITMGDPAGIGPEIIMRAIHHLNPRIAAGDLKLVVIGSHEAHRSAADLLDLVDHAKLISPDLPVAQWPDIAFLQAGVATEPIRFGQVSAQAGNFAFQAIRMAVELALSGDVAAICTGPLNKEALNLAGHAFAGHTEILAHLTRASDSVMMLAHGNMRVSHVTTHVALADVPSRMTTERIRRVVDLTEKALRKLGIARPRIAIAALNPHAGEGGLFGREDIEVTEPLVAALRKEGRDIDGPVPGDTVFVKLRAGQYDAVVAQYHDQGHTPIKLLGFSVDPETGRWEALSGVNITLGLPVIRTSVDHGTAFDIAGKGLAKETSLVEAIEYALQMADAGAGQG